MSQYKSKHQQDAERYLRECEEAHAICAKVTTDLEERLANTLKPSQYLQVMTLGDLLGANKIYQSVGNRQGLHQ